MKTLYSSAIVFLVSLALTAAIRLPAQAPTLDLTHFADYTWDGPYPDWGSMVGDSLKEVVSWKQPSDTIEAGKVDSTIIVFRVSKPAVYYSGGAIVANVNSRRVYTAELADSFKLARPALADTATFRVVSFIQCRRGLCSLPGSAAWKHIHDYTPGSSAPSVKETLF